MANTLTNLIPDFYRALDVVSRELSGFVPAVTMDAQAARAAVGQTVRVPITPAAAAEDVVPGTNPPDTGDQDIGNTPIVISKARAVPFRWTGEEQRGLNNGGPGYLTIRQGQIAQAIRTLVNEMEADLAGLYNRASRAYGTAGTVPFAASIADSAQVLKVLQDNGCPLSDLQMVIGTDAGVNLRSLSNLFKVNEAGDGGQLLRQGVLGNLHGFDVRESAGIKSHVAGTGAGYVLNGAAAAGDTAIDVDTGAGTILAGDVVTLDDGRSYVVGTALSAGTVTVNEPGAMEAIADGSAVALAANFRAHMAFHRSAMILVARPPAIPEEGDMATDSMLVTDPRTGLTFEIRVYAQYRRIRYEVCLAWGVANIKPAHTALLIG